MRTLRPSQTRRFSALEVLASSTPGASAADEAARRSRRTSRAVGELAQALRGGVDPHVAARFLDRVVFCMFAEDVGLLRKGSVQRGPPPRPPDPTRLRPMLSRLFDAMASGGYFGPEEIKRFNGNLFNDAAVLDLPNRD